MIALDIKVKHHSALSDLQKRIGAPLVEIASIVLARVHARTMRGQGPYGPLTLLGGDRHMTGRRFWVAPDKNQPPGYVFKVPDTAVRKAGFAVYKDYPTYMALGGNVTRDLYDKGDLWRSAAVRLQNPARATVNFYGFHAFGKGRIRNEGLAHMHMRNEVAPLFRLNDEDRRIIREMVLSKLSADMVNASAQAGQVFKASQKASALGKRYSKILAGRR